jgi:hypothetical protein
MQQLGNAIGGFVSAFAKCPVLTTQPFAHGLLAHRHRPSRGDLFAKVDTSPTYHTVPLWIRPLEYDGFQFLPADLVQSRWAARAGPRSQPAPPSALKR